MAARVLLDCKRPPKGSSRELLLMSKKLSAVHPGEVLREEFLVPMKLSPYTVARVIGAPPPAPLWRSAFLISTIAQPTPTL